MRTIRSAAGVVLALLAIGLYYQAFRDTADVVVMRTATGFVPQKVIVKKGQTVVFRSDTGKGFWPASDSHPTHAIYTEFDPKHELAHGDEWRFVALKPGVWVFHDHLAPEMKGTIIVIGAPGESTAGCLASTASSSVKATCWEGDITDTLATKGLDAAFDLFRSFYESDSQFRGLNCHDAGHIIGAAAYKRYSSDHAAIDRPEVSYCGYGFYHGFMEAMLVDQGAGHYQQVHNYCAALKRGPQLNSASGACFHGIGHAAFDSLSGDLWGDDVKMVADALSKCETILTDEEERVQCTTGVYNSLANAYSAHSYRLSFSAAEPLGICRAQSALYRPGCYREVGIGVIRDTFMDRAASIRFIKSLGAAADIAAVLGAYADDEAKRHIDEPDMSGLRELCTAFTHPDEERACMRGIVSGMRTVGTPGKEYVRIFAYCDAYAPKMLRTECFSFAIPQVRNLASDQAAFQASCSVVAPADLCK